MTGQTYSVRAEHAGFTLAAFLRLHCPGQSWNTVRRWIATRRVTLGGELCLDAARRLLEGETIALFDRPAAKPHANAPVVVRYLDRHLVVVEKPSGLPTVRHPTERHWPRRRKALSPTLEDLVPALIVEREGRKRRGPLPRLRIVQRLDKDTSGLIVFARTVAAERGLGRQFQSHSVTRRYLAIVPGSLSSQRIASRLVRDRGDGRRGSTLMPDAGKIAVTHVEVVERVPGFTLISCRLETGRTHQIRIHLAELGHPVCGEKVYRRTLAGPGHIDTSGAPRLALHAADLGFTHPVTGKHLHWTMDMPADLTTFWHKLRSPLPP
jgi:23S rRNA pseudouridine1911/1915/1917 synthase